MKESNTAIISRRRLLQTLAGAALLPATGALAQDEPMPLLLDHVMFPVYNNNAFLETVEQLWRQRELGRVFSQPQNQMFKGVYAQSRSLYVEYLSTVESQPYWSNALYIIVPTKYWDFYPSPALRNEHFLIPSFGCGYQLVSPDFPYLNHKLAEQSDYDGFEVLISETLARELRSLAGQSWRLPESGKIRVHKKLKHVHEMAVIDQSGKIVAPLLEANPVLREYL